MNIEDYGHWEGMTFVFNEPREIGGQIIEKIDMSMMQMPDETITPADIVAAFLDPIATITDAEGMGGQFKPIHLPPH